MAEGTGGSSGPGAEEVVGPCSKQQIQGGGNGDKGQVGMMEEDGKGSEEELMMELKAKHMAPMVRKLVIHRRTEKRSNYIKDNRS